MYQYFLKQREDNDFDLIIEVERREAEFGLDFLEKNNGRSAYDRFVQ